MATKRAASTRFPFFWVPIAAGVIGLILLLQATTTVLDRLELRVQDGHFALRQVFRSERVQEGVSLVEHNPHISPDILLVGIDPSTLARFGRWPFPRGRHADLIDSFTRVSNPDNRERALFLDLFFIEPSESAVDDALLLRSIQNNDRVFLETIVERSAPLQEHYQEYFARHEALFQAAGRIKNVQGDWSRMPSFFGIQAPLQPYARAVRGYGHANIWDDHDGILRRQPMIARVSERLESYRFDTLLEDYGSLSLNPDAFERLIWFDRSGNDHDVALPLSEERLRALLHRLDAEAPRLPIDTTGDGDLDGYTFLLHHHQEQFIPAITLSLALEYFNKSLDDIQVRLGESIVIPAPQSFNSREGVWEPYRIQTRPPVIDENGQEIQEARYRPVEEIAIPIDEDGAMRINYMGRRSSPARDGYQTFPVRPYHGYAGRIPDPDPQSWPATRAVENKIVMVGAFAQGMADDEKMTPYGLMYGVEVHANALNTILMDRFIYHLPGWGNTLILAGGGLLVALLAAWFSTIWAMAGTLVLLVVFFFSTTIAFDLNSVVIAFAAPALTMALCFVSVVVYRVTREERDKRRIRDVFGKYVSPAVVSEILQSPPELGGVDKELTVFFSDIRGFTTLSESLSPQELVNHLNLYLTAMTDTILAYQGTLDKYVGDEIMCFWGAPLPQEDHALLACKSALKQLQVLDQMNSEWPPEKRINIGIGINSGIMTVGNMGSLGRMNYTLMGDNVNLGARLEGTNKEYATRVIISEHTYGLVRDKIIARELDNIRVKGKNKPVVIYELIDVPEGLDPGSVVSGRS
ncbi:adenylate cyclase [Alkalispirochaeta americana]|uniref:Adenylate cyclase n=1 Tax=Alkalispirochaeta americana TaxID=159291 RepID=A0A1N6P6P8_9SPIO|nr:adenylate/guanylate cyclase domain-containing protein [Alkalispirochaeta americana]SIP99969.1 adenylate cyclase [Alkalispirochaeta americana]